jgi:hypothetical protein
MLGLIRMRPGQCIEQRKHERKKDNGSQEAESNHAPKLAKAFKRAHSKAKKTGLLDDC